MRQFRLDGRVAVITGGAGLLGVQHAGAIAEAGGIPILWDVDEAAAKRQAQQIASEYAVRATGMRVDVTDRASVVQGMEAVHATHDRLDILINNAASNPKVENGDAFGGAASRLENFSLETWHRDLAVGLTGAFLCSQVLGSAMAQRRGGVILNIASDLALIGPDQRIYRQADKPDNQQPVKPVTYSVVKGGLLSLTRYLATYWADKNVRVNAICPGGVQNGQDQAFVERLTQLIPMGRMARRDEYRAAVVFLCSDASSYMTGSHLVMDGGRTAW